MSVIHNNSLLPGWLQSPTWFRPLAYAIDQFVNHHQALGLFLVITAEELGIPLPVPGDVAITWGGYLTTTGAIPLPLACVSVVAGATLGSLGLYTISRRYGHPFMVRFGRYVGLEPALLERAERAFRRWGPWAIIFGRHIPGMRIVLSAFAGVVEVPIYIFVPSVIVSASLWAGIFLTVGRVLGRRSRFLFQLLPVHLLPIVVLGLLFLAALYVGYERGWRPIVRARRRLREAGRANNSDGTVGGLNQERAAEPKM
jgi:membrane protein DedA with SNARE-associated domain